MGLAIMCDGCGKAVREAKDVTEFGLVNKTEYCKDCVDSVLNFLNAQDQLHTDIAAQFQSKRDALIDAWLKDHPSGTLPDE